MPAEVAEVSLAEAAVVAVDVWAEVWLKIASSIDSFVLYFILE